MRGVIFENREKRAVFLDDSRWRARVPRGVYMSPPLVRGLRFACGADIWTNKRMKGRWIRS
jgi:hypothetical protein